MSLERKTSAILRNEIDSVNVHEGVNRFEASRLESILQRYEQRVFDLEELEVELREKISALEFALQTSVWFWTSFLMSSGHRLSSRPMIVYVEDPNENISKPNNQTQSTAIMDVSNFGAPDQSRPVGNTRIAECTKNNTLEDEIMQRTVYKEELEELKTKEVAYKETIQKADAILAKVSTIVPKQNVVRMH